MTAQKPPDFILAGAPKCGTTTVFNMLAAHPAVCMSEPKETFFFNPEMPNRRRFDSVDAYLTAFSKCNAGKKLRGDGSVWSMYSPSFPENAVALNSEIKVVVLLRHPAKLVNSMYHYNLEKGYEDAPSLTRALELESDRAQGRNIPTGCPEPSFLMYRRIVDYSSYLKKLRATLPEERLFVADPFAFGFEKTVKELFDFLKLGQYNVVVEPANRTSYSTNPGILKVIRLARWLRGNFGRIGIRPPQSGIIRRLRDWSNESAFDDHHSSWLNTVLVDAITAYERELGHG